MRNNLTRASIVETADKLFYQQGYEKTSFADIAKAIKISRGNFYYHFKTKDDILNAVINIRLAKTHKMLQQWEAESNNPADRIRSFIHILHRNEVKIRAFGCPVGTLCTELSKLNHVSLTSANRLFKLFQSWLAQQFRLLGHIENADQLAMHFLARSQGVATLANVFHNEEFIQQEVKLMCDWLDSITHNPALKTN